MPEGAGGALVAPPSAYSAAALVRGQPGALVGVLVHTGCRTVMIALGLTVAGVRRPWGPALVSALALEVFLVGWCAAMRSPPR